MSNSSELSRESLVERALKPQVAYSTMFKYGFTMFGSMKQQITSFHYKFVDKQRWITDTQFFEIVRVCQSLPGPTPIEILILITTLTTKSPLVGVLSFILFCLPSIVIYGGIAIFTNHFYKNYESMPVQIRLMLIGFKAAGGGLLFRKAVQSIFGYLTKPFEICTIVVTSILYYLFPTTTCVETCFILGVLISLYVKTETTSTLSKNARLVMRNMKKYGWIFGKWAFAILVGLYIVLAIHFRLDPNSEYYFIYIFYFVGCIIFGPSTALFPLLYPQLIQTNEMTNDQFWLGIPLTFLIPGVPTNISMYYGTIIHGLSGGILSWIFLHIPPIMIIFGILPNWDSYRDRAGIQRIIIGISCVTLGILCGCALLALNYATIADHAIPLTLFILSMFLAYLGFPSYSIILVSGLLANFRRWGLVYFRELEQPVY